MGWRDYIPFFAAEEQAAPAVPAIPDMSFSQRADSWGSDATFIGTEMDKAMSFKVRDNGRVSDAEIDILYRDNALVKRFVNIVPDEATREGWTLTGDIDSDTLTSLINEEKRLKIRHRFRKAGRLARKSGGALIYIATQEVGNPSLSAPLSPEKLIKIHGLVVLEKGEFSPSHWDTDIVTAGSNFGRPSHWNLQPTHTYGSGWLPDVHWSRCIYIPGEEASNQDRAANDGCDESVIQHVYQAFRNRGIVDRAAGTLATELKVDALYIHELTERSVEDTRANFLSRLSLMMQSKSNNRAVLLDKNDQYVPGSGGVGGFGELDSNTMYQIGASTGIAITILFGQAPGGLSTDDTSGRESFNRLISGYRDNVLRDPLEYAYTCIFAATKGPTQGLVPTFQVSFPPLAVPTPKEQADTEKVYADIDKSNIEAGIYTPERAALRYADGMFKTTLPLEDDDDIDEAEIESLLGALESELLAEPTPREDAEMFKVPESARNNARKVIRWREEHGDRVRGMTRVGWVRARQLADKGEVSRDIVGRMAAFARHRKNAQVDPRFSSEPWRDAGYVSWLGWGGTTGVEWAAGVLERERNDADPPAPPKDRIKGSRSNPKGSASGSRGGIEISKATEKTLRTKVDDHNEKHGSAKSKRVDLGMLKAVYRRGAGAYSTSHRKGVSRDARAKARVNAFLVLVKNGRPANSKYVGDNDLLPKGHPKKSEQKK